MKRRTKLVLTASAVIAAIAAVAGSAAVGGHAASPPAAQPSPAVAALTANALAFAATNGDPDPTSGRLVATTRSKGVAAATGSSVDSDQNVYVVTLRGHFVAYDAKVMRGAPIPHGSVLTIIYDAATNAVTDWSVTDTDPDLASLGAVQSIPTQ